ncbi:hypothetical protein Ppa06_70490 [Planomonospora parontospora subsp. parontospora]|uniref:Uncharacterized protein n=2 Tax=Planomonospora parontospora TaxID=58119 RepID=A0AA37BP49_9ACTN|nr:hypothetical protein GCM10010126_71070 [Planomonospora parontospora]GII13251.1 hypothetical protein Ppa06_70490 [Planomonospora parontospora subsp. parontospora]
MSTSPGPHLLTELVFPARYEALSDRLGHQLASVLVSPEHETRDLLEDTARALTARGEGLFVPIYAPSGTGKTTLANNLDTFLPGTFTPTLSFAKDVDADTLQTETLKHLREFPVNNQKIVPINIDHREGSPPTGTELAAIKRFLRQPGTGHKALILWPETSPDLSLQMAESYIKIAGRSPVKLPIHISGPPRETWVDIARSTLRLANSLDSLEDLGVEPKDYDPAEYLSIGDYLRAISDDFTRLAMEMLRATRMPLRLAIVFASESSDAGVLTHLTSSNRFGLLDGNALLDASPESEVGRWWSKRRGLLTSAIVRLDARVFGLPPSASIGILRRFGPETVQEQLAAMQIRMPGEQQIVRNIERCDVGKYLLGKSRATFETKGTPTTTSLAAFQLIAETGFQSGKDKLLNYAMAQALTSFTSHKGLECATKAETSLGFCPLIPDNSLVFEREAVCFEYTWRGSDFLTAKNRGNIAAYCLTKIRNYCRELNWVPE